MNREKRLIKNTAIFAIGNLGSKVLSFTLVPVYTFYLSVSQYGYYDIISSTISLLMPLLSFQISDGIYRHLIESKTEKKKSFYISSAMFVLFISLIISNFAFVLLLHVHPIKYGLLILMQFDTNVFYTVIMETCRGLKKNVKYSVSGIINTLCILLLNIVLIIVFHHNTDALLISNTIANLIVILYLAFSAKIFRYLHASAISKVVIKLLLKYSVPLIPNTVSWWIMNVSDRYLINIYMGMDANGIYAISNKFTGILIALYSIFNLAWQQSAIEEYKSDDKNRYYSKIFNTMMIVETSSVILLIGFTRLIIRIMASASYYSSANYVPFLYLAFLFSSFSSYYGAGYITSKETKGAFTTSVIGGGANIAINLFLIPVAGLQGASLSTMVAFFVMWLLRVRQTHKYFKIKIRMRPAVLLAVLCAVSILLFYLNLNYSLMVFSVCVFATFNFKYLRALRKQATSKLFARRT